MLTSNELGSALPKPLHADDVGNAVKVATEATEELAEQVSAKAADLADAASQQTKTFASELERIGRQNPLGALAGALLVGVVIGLVAWR
jgi:ElaB/YqjD/DUF883 family membrane-anchored ribosome-binding protein